MDKFINNWLNTFILSQPDSTALHSCGRKCAVASGMIDEIQKNMAKHPFTPDTKAAFAAYLDCKIFKTHQVDYKEDQIKITYDFDACICPVMTQHQIKNPKACQCTLGFLKQCLETIWPGTYDITLVDSYIFNNKPCAFTISRTA